MSVLYTYIRSIQSILHLHNQSGQGFTHVLDGLLYHESDLDIREHYTDTAGFTEHVFALMHLLGFAFCPRILDLHDKNFSLKVRRLNIRHFIL